jgi:hypothetical protein
VESAVTTVKLTRNVNKSLKEVEGSCKRKAFFLPLRIMLNRKKGLLI